VTAITCLVRRAFQDALLLPLVRGYCSPFRTSGQLGVGQGPLVIVANHASHMDTPAILAALPPRIRHRTCVAAAADYFYRNPLLGAATTVGIGTFAFARHGRGGTDTAAELLRDGWNVLIFPQGTRGATDEWLPFRSGVGHLVAETGARVLPIGVRGTRRMWPRGQRLPRRGAIDVRLGDIWLPEAELPAGAIVAELERRVASLASR
jgi:1-acyl-sn-glycerol-3-phosphate acyltransferase